MSYTPERLGRLGHRTPLSRFVPLSGAFPKSPEDRAVGLFQVRKADKVAGRFPFSGPLAARLSLAGRRRPPAPLPADNFQNTSKGEEKQAKLRRFIRPALETSATFL
jgi:hypothetical protein